MDKRLMVLYIIVSLAMLGMTVFLEVGPEDGTTRSFGLIQIPEAQGVNDVVPAPRYSTQTHLVAGICALLLVGYFFWVLFRKSQKDSQAELMAKRHSLYEMSLATGRTEYELFYKSAEQWSLSGERIDQDYDRYMIDQVIPHYVTDFIRKNQIHLDESLVAEKDLKPTSWLDWAKALLVFPGSILALFSMTALLSG